MKIQCNCGTKYSFDVTPEMARQPIRFVCQSCGLDSSELVNQLIRQQFPQAAPTASSVPVATLLTTTPSAAPAPASAPAPAPVRPAVKIAVSTPPAAPAPAPSAPAPVQSGRPLRVSAPSAASEGTTPPAAEATTAAPPSRCTKHPTHEVTHACLVCHKPMCPQCMQVTGLVCSPFCLTKAEAQGIDVPVYKFQRDVAQRRQWRKVALVAGGIGAVIVAALGFWFWYAWIGSVPKVAYAHAFPNSGTHGQLHFGPNRQLIVLHGGTLARHDLDARRLVWSVELFDRNKIIADSAAELEARVKARNLAIKNGADAIELRIPPLETITRDNIEAAEAGFDLQGVGENIWIVTEAKLTRYSWADGKSDKEVAVDETYDDPSRFGQELLFVSEEIPGIERVLRVDLTSGETKTEGPPKPSAPTTAAGAARRPGTKGGATTASAGPTGSGKTPGKTIDPASLATRAQNLPFPNRAALPATIATAENQRRLQAAMNEDEDMDERPRAARPTPRKTGANKLPPESIVRIRTSDGTIELGTRLLEEKIIVREAMKAAPKVSALEGTVNAAATVDIANELLNEMQRDRAGSTVEEDASRYQATVRRVDPSTSSGQGSSAPAPWTGEVIGSPTLHPLKTVDVIAAGKGLVVLDKKNQKLWETKLNFAVAGRGVPEDLMDLNEDAGGKLSSGEGPCVERGDTLYVFDQGVVTSFALANGSVRWRLPSVGTTGLWFDDQGMLYVNTTTATPDSIKYSKQIDISQKQHSLVLKVDPHTGKTLWGAQNEGWVTYLWGKFVYTVESSGGTEDEEADAMLGVKTGFEIPAHIRLKRLDPGNGRVLWEHYQKRHPLDVHFDQNTIQFLFKKELQHLRFVVL